MKCSIHYISLTFVATVVSQWVVTWRGAVGKVGQDLAPVNIRPTPFLFKHIVAASFFFWSVVPQIDLYMIEDNISKIIDIWLEGS